jgi:hypothetical protein
MNRDPIIGDRGSTESFQHQITVELFKFTDWDGALMGKNNMASVICIGYMKSPQ